MTNARYRKALKKLGLSPRDMARLLGFDARTSRRYADGSAIPPPVCIIVEFLIDEKITVAEVREVRERGLAAAARAARR